MPRYHETLMTSDVDGAARTVAAAATMLPAAAIATIPAGYLATIGHKLHIRASGRISSVITTPGTARFDVRLGGTVVFDGLAVLLETAAAYVNVGWWLEIILTLRAKGTAANFMGLGYFTSHNLLGVPAAPPKPALTAMLPWNSAPAVGGNFDSTVSQTLDVQFTQTVATGSLTNHQYTVESVY